MDIQTVRDFAEETPFQPFRLRLTSGREVTVPHPEFIAFHPGGLAIIVFTPRSISLIDPAHLESVEWLQTADALA